MSSYGIALNPFGSYRKQGTSYCFLYQPPPSAPLKSHLDSKVCIKVSL